MVSVDAHALLDLSWVQRWPTRLADRLVDAAARRSRRQALARMRPHFDAAFYLGQSEVDIPPGADPLSHYLSEGWRKQRDPSRIFSARQYRALHATGLGPDESPLEHFSRHKARRRPARTFLEHVCGRLQAEGRPQWREAQALLTRLEAERPDLLGKAFSPLYLCKRMDEAARVQALLSHFTLLFQGVRPEALERLAGAQGVVLWRAGGDPDGCRIVLKISPQWANEGEMTLFFHAGDTNLFELAFNLARADDLGAGGEDAVILITRLQGVRGVADRIRAASQALNGIHPVHVLVSALAGVGAAFGAPRMLGIDAASQIAFRESLQADFERMYDAFYETLGGWRATPYAYELPLPLWSKPLAEVQRSHRRRTAARRSIKRAVAAGAEASLRPLLH